MIANKPASKEMMVGGSSSRQLAWERLIWAVQPLLGLVLLFGWVLNPEVVDQVQIEQEALLGFFFGMLFGILNCWRELKSILTIKFESGVYSKNRVPAEFYWGAKRKILFLKGIY